MSSPTATSTSAPRIGHYVAAIVVCCLLGGLALTLGLAALYDSIQTEAGTLRRDSETLRELADLRRQARSWLATTHAAISAGSSNMGKLDSEAQRLLLQAELLARVETLAETHDEEFDAVAETVQAVREGLAIASAFGGDAPREEEQRAEVAAGLEALAGVLTRSLRDLEASVRRDFQTALATHEGRRDRMWHATWFGVVAYVALILALWRWTVMRLIKPLQALTMSALTSRRQGDTAFPMQLDGPREVRQLAASFSSLVSNLVAAREGLEERVRQRTEELEQANRAKSDFLANVSHEIRTPMTAILGYAKLCQDPETTEEDRRKHFDVIELSGEHLLAVINDVLDISKIEARQVEVTRRRSSPFLLMAEVLAVMEVPAGEKGLGLRVACAGPVPEAVETDPNRLRQILLNLVANAIKFTDEGEILITMSMTHAVGHGERLTFEVSDTGMGMTPDQVGRIFEPFAQADASATRQFGGAGLGLSISKSLAKLLGGDIRCESESGVGSRFIVTIDPGPLEGVQRRDRFRSRDRSGKSGEDGASRAPSRLEGRVLLVEDVAVSRRLVAILLTKAGMTVEEAENGLIALAKGKAALESGKPYDLVFMDMQMPEMDGYEATRRLREEGYDRPIIALTAHALVEEREKCIQAGCDHFATKPIDKEALLEVAARFLAPVGDNQAA